jgi:hypothetical protein
MKKLLSVMLTISLFACQPSADMLIEQGRLATQQNELGLALDSFSKVLTMDQLSNEQSYKGKWGQSEVYRKQGNFKAQTDALEDIYQNPNYANYLSVVLDALEESYMAEAKKIQSSRVEDSIALLKKLLSMKTTSTDASQMLAELQIAQAKQLIADAQQGSAVVILKEVLALPLQDDELKKTTQSLLDDILIQDFQKQLNKAFDESEDKKKYFDESKQLISIKASFALAAKLDDQNKETLTKEAQQKIKEQASALIQAWIAKLIPVKTPANEIPFLVELSFDKPKMISKKDKTWETVVKYEAKLSKDLFYQIAYQSQK